MKHETFVRNKKTNELNFYVIRSFTCQQILDNFFACKEETMPQRCGTIKER